MPGFVPVGGLPLGGTPRATTGGLKHYGKRKKRYVDPDFWEKRNRGFSRKVWEEMVAAQQVLLEQAEDEKNKRRKKALETAAREAAPAIEEANEASDAELLIRALKELARAQTVAKAIERSRIVVKTAQSILEDEEEEEMIVLLLLQ